MSTKVYVEVGTYRGEEICNQVFDLVEGFKTGKSGSWITVRGNGNIVPLGQKFRLKVNGANAFKIISDGAEESDNDEIDDEPEVLETEKQVMDRIRRRFHILDEMTRAVGQGIVRGLIVSGPPGVGKSFGIEAIMDQFKLAGQILDDQGEISVSRGQASALGMYKLLYQHSTPGSVLVLDDSDSILYDELTLGLLKAALDSTKKRVLSWNTESRVLADERIPNTFEFEGSMIFITNIKFENARGKIGQHLAAITSRCHYIDLTINSSRDKYLRCKQVVQDGMLASYNFSHEDEQELMDYIESNKERLREISLRMIKKIADLRKMSRDEWREYVEATCMKH